MGLGSAFVFGSAYFRGDWLSVTLGWAMFVCMGGRDLLLTDFYLVGIL